MSIKFYNTLTRKVEEFIPFKKGIVTIYSCGPTVYDYAHIGNFRSYIFSDLLRRFLKYKGYKVIHVMNITDVDDKTIKRHKEEGVSLKEYTEKFTQEFFKDIEILNIEKVEYYPKATEHINDMIDLIKKLEANGYTYISNGSVYFKISNFKDYGKLSKIDLNGIKEGIRVDVDEYNKEDVRDFVLWKARKNSEPYWDTEYGEGRPGWHIECSAMSMKYLGETIDIHTGGIDLIFPHHENEIAQSEGATGKQFVRYWLHCAHLIVEGEKMSKSKGNFFTLRDLLNKGYNPLAIRYLLLSTHYRKQLNFTFNSLNGAKQAVDRYQGFYRNLKNYVSPDRQVSGIKKIFLEKIKLFNEDLENDLNISGGIGHLFELIRIGNYYISKQELTLEEKEYLLKEIEKIDTILGLLMEEEQKLPEEVKELIKQREKARKEKNYKKADEIREEIKRVYGIILEDTRYGVRWRKIK